MAGALTQTQSYSSAQSLFTPIARKTFSDHYSSKKAEPNPSLFSDSAYSHFSQPKRHPSLPPRPPVVVSTSTVDRTDGHPRYLNEFDRAFNDLAHTTRGMKSSDVMSPTCAVVKGILLLGPYGSSDCGLHESRLQR